MKQLIIIATVFIAFSCKAQSIIIPIGSGEICVNNPNCYEKDVNNEFNKFDGTWKYQEGNTEIVFKLKKEEHYLTPSNYNVDLLVVEYQYMENGVYSSNTIYFKVE